MPIRQVLKLESPCSWRTTLRMMFLSSSINWLAPWVMKQTAETQDPEEEVVEKFKRNSGDRISERVPHWSLLRAGLFEGTPRPKGRLKGKIHFLTGRCIGTSVTNHQKQHVNVPWGPNKNSHGRSRLSWFLMVICTFIAVRFNYCTSALTSFPNKTPEGSEHCWCC